MIVLAAALAHAHDPLVEGDLARDVVVTLPIPISRPGPGDKAFCHLVSPTLQTSDIFLEADGLEVHCGSSPRATFLCLRVPASTPWPESFWSTTCPGRGHELQVSFVPGHDPNDDPADGLDVVRVGGPRQLSRDRAVTFLVPGWPDAIGPIASGGACEVRDGKLALFFREPPTRRTKCRLGEPVDRTIAIRMRSPRWRLRNADPEE